MLVSRRDRLLDVGSLSQQIETVTVAAAAPHANHPPGLGVLHMLRESRVCDFHFPVELHPHPRPHDWQNLELNQLGTEGPILAPGPSPIHHKTKRHL